MESCRENLWNEIQLKGPSREKKTQEQNKKEWASSVGLCQETFIKRYVAEGTNKAEIRPEEQSEKMESCLDNS